MRCYPESTSNRNVPANVFLVAEAEAMSGEVIVTYYVDSSGYLNKVTDWKDNRPRLASVDEVCQLTGDTEKMVNAHYHQWLDSQEVIQ